MALSGLIRAGLVAAVFSAAASHVYAQEGAPPEGSPPPAEVAPPAEGEMPPPENAPVAPTPEQPAEAAPTPSLAQVPIIPSTENVVPDINQNVDVRGALTQRLFMDVVTGVAGAAVILVLGWAVAVPLALIPWALPRSVNNQGIFGVPVSMLITGAAVGVVLISSVAASAAIQRVVRPLLGPQPSFLGPILGAVFFGGVGAAVGLVGSYLLVTSPPAPLRDARDRIIGDISTAEGKALALTGAITVALAVPMAAVGAAVGGPVSAEVEDSRAVDAAASAGKAAVQSSGAARSSN